MLVTSKSEHLITQRHNCSHLFACHLELLTFWPTRIYQSLIQSDFAICIYKSNYRWTIWCCLPTFSIYLLRLNIFVNLTVLNGELHSNYWNSKSFFHINDFLWFRWPNIKTFRFSKSFFYFVTLLLFLQWVRSYLFIKHYTYKCSLYYISACSLKAVFVWCAIYYLDSLIS